MNTLNELVATMAYPPVAVNPTPVEKSVTQEQLTKFMEKVQNKLDSLSKNVLTKNGYDLQSHIRLNRPLKWRYNWKGEKKYAILGKECLEYWHANWERWEPVHSYEGAERMVRAPS